MSIWDKFTSFLVMKDDDDDYAEDEVYEEAPVRKDRKPAAEKEKIENLRPERKVYRRNQDSEREVTPEPVARERKIDRTNKIVPIRSTSSGVEVYIMKPTSFDESQDVVDLLLDGKAVVVNLEGFDMKVAQRIMDFISGAVYSMQGKLHGVSQYIFILSPSGIDISGDYMDEMDRFDVPNINDDF